jgi:hypothetical protein
VVTMRRALAGEVTRRRLQHRVHVEAAVDRWRHPGAGLVDVMVARIEPISPPVRSDRHGHPVMDPTDAVGRGGRDDPVRRGDHAGRASATESAESLRVCFAPTAPNGLPDFFANMG